MRNGQHFENVDLYILLYFQVEAGISTDIHMYPIIVIFNRGLVFYRELWDSFDNFNPCETTSIFSYMYSWIATDVFIFCLNV
jgi:hypothetical protein